MRELILALTASCAIAGACYARAPYQEPPRLLPDLSDISIVPQFQEPDFSIEFGFTAYSEPKKPEPKPSLSRLERARKYTGTNPTGWASLWCAKFMTMIEPQLAQKLKNPNLAREWAQLPKAPKQVGSIVVLSRGSGGHIGIITKVMPNGDLVILSGNHNHKVAEGRYSKRRILAIVG